MSATETGMSISTGNGEIDKKLGGGIPIGSLSPNPPNGRREDRGRG